MQIFQCFETFLRADRLIRHRFKKPTVNIAGLQLLITKAN